MVHVSTKSAVGWNCIEPQVASLTMQGFASRPCRFSCPIAVVAIPWNNCTNTRWLGVAEKIGRPVRDFVREKFARKNAFLSAEIWVWKREKKSQTIFSDFWSWSDGRVSFSKSHTRQPFFQLDASLYWVGYAPTMSPQLSTRCALSRSSKTFQRVLVVPAWQGTLRRAVPTKGLFKENAPFIFLIWMGSFARTLFSRTLLPWPVLCYSGEILHARFSNTSFGRTLLGSNFWGLLLEQTFCRHCAAFPQGTLRKNNREKIKELWETHVEIRMSIHFFRVHMDRGVFSLEKVCTSVRNPHGKATHVDHHMAIHTPRSTKGFNAMCRSLLSEFSGKPPQAFESSRKVK